MSNLMTRDTRTTSPQTPVMEPFRMMRELMRWDPFRDNLLTLEPQTFMPSFEVKETPTAYVFKADLPGIKEEDLDISLTGNQLVVSGNREQESNKETERFHLYERTHGRFSRIFTLPDGVNPDQVAANLKDGVLTLTVGKKPEVQPRKISLSTKAQGSA